MRQQRKQAIYAKKWWEFHPEGLKSPSDMYYQHICNQILELLNNPVHELDWFLIDEEIINLACILTCYFEDVISESRIWQSFTSEHHRLYGKYLPFYKTSDDYYADEINPEDIAFLIWHHYTQLLLDEEQLFSPLSPGMLHLAHQVYDIFDGEYEVAPENKKLKEFITLSDDEWDFYKIREKMDWLALSSYLNYKNRVDCSLEKAEVIKRIDSGEMPPNTIEMIKDIHDKYVVNKSTPILAYRPNELLAAINGKDHPLYQDVLNVIPKKNGYYIFINEDDDNLWFRHIATGFELPVTRKSMNRMKDWVPEKTIVALGVTRWKEEWWFSGVMSVIPGYQNDKLIDGEMNSVIAKGMFNQDEERNRIALEALENPFLKLSGGHPVAYFSMPEEFEKFLDKFRQLQNKIARADNNIGQNENLDPEKVMPDMNFPPETRNVPLLAFFNPKSGVEVVLGYNAIISDPKNKFYDENEDARYAMGLILGNDYSAEVVKWFMEHDYIEGACFEGPGGDELVRENLDFLLRYFKKEDYSQPEVTIQ